MQTQTFFKEIELILLFWNTRGGGEVENINSYFAYTSIKPPIDHRKEQVVACLQKKNILMYYLLHVKDYILT